MTAVDTSPTRTTTRREPAPWVRCAGCGTSLYGLRLARGLKVCPDCGHHHRLSARERLETLADDGSFRPVSRPARAVDPLGFTDSLPYPERLAGARARTGLDDAVLTGRATIGGHAVVIAVMDFGFIGGSMGSAVGEAVTRAAEESLRERIPLVVVSASGGARMQEGALSLMQMAKTAQAFQRLRRAGVLSMCVLTNPTFGGVTASFATLADLLVAEHDSLVGFAGPRVIANATRETLPPGFQSARDLLDRGLVDRVEPRAGIGPLLGRILRLYARAAAPGDVPEPPAAVRGAAVRTDPLAVLRLARDVARPTALDHIGEMCHDFVELHGDRTYGDDPAIVGGLADLDGRTVMVIGHQKGHDTAELVARNFGMPNPEGFRKAQRLMTLADRLGVPVVTLVDTQGAAPGVGAEQRGQAWAVAECIATMTALRVPAVSVITGEGGSGGALALAVGNRVLMLENACYSVISPESCSTILHGDPSRAAEMAEALRITAPELLRLGIADGIVPEPPGGAHTAPRTASELLARAVGAALADLTALDPDTLVRQRHDRFRRQGTIADD